MGLFARLFGTFTNAAQGVKMKILLIGLDNSGKTTILNVLKPGKTQLNTVPTVGCATEQFAKAGIQFTAVDMSGQSKYRSLWEQYYEDTEVGFTRNSSQYTVVPDARTVRVGLFGIDSSWAVLLL